MDLGDAARIVDDLYAEKRRTGRSPRKKLVVIVGNGIRRIANILNDDSVKQEARKRRIRFRSRAFQEFKWRLFEYARYYTAYSLPTLGHAVIHRLVKDGICRDVITTNYDLCFDAIWSKYPNLGVHTNPVLAPDEYNWDGYYSPANIPALAPRYWKIHGSLDYVVFRERIRGPRLQIHRLPRFPISSNQPDLAKAFKLNGLAPFLGYESSCHPATAIGAPSHLEPTFVPFIDWTFDNIRDLFDREISAVKAIIQNTNEVAAVLLVGFRGYYNNLDSSDPWNEELVPVLDDLQSKGNIPLLMAVHNNQYSQRSDPESWFMRRLISAGSCEHFDAPEQFVEALFRDNSQRFPFGYAKGTHSIWRSHYFLTMSEGRHV